MIRNTSCQSLKTYFTRLDKDQGPPPPPPPHLGDPSADTEKALSIYYVPTGTPWGIFGPANPANHACFLGFHAAGRLVPWLLGQVDPRAILDDVESVFVYFNTLFPFRKLPACTSARLAVLYAITSLWVWSVDLLLKFVLSIFELQAQFSEIEDRHLHLIVVPFHFTSFRLPLPESKATTEREKRVHGAQLQPEKSTVIELRSETQWLLSKKNCVIRDSSVFFRKIQWPTSSHNSWLRMTHNNPKRVMGSPVLSKNFQLRQPM